MSEDQSRRDALRGALAFAASMGAAMAASMARPREAHAQAAAGDVTTLTALQRAEYDAIRTYSTAESILMTDLSSDPQASTVRAVAAYYRGQHEAHANALRTAITAAGGTPIDPTTVFFMPPTGFRATVANIIKLAANKEKAAAVAYAEAVRSLGTAERAQLAAAIGGVETQHWIVLYLLAKGVVQPGMNAATMLNQLCPQAFVASVGTGTAGLEAVAEYQYAPNAT